MTPPGPDGPATPGPGMTRLAPLESADIAAEMREHLRRGAVPRAEPRPLPVPAAPAAPPETGARPPLPSAAPPGDLPGLLALNGATFVAAAYAAILRRDVDPDGIRHWTERLARGLTKIEILGDLRWSPEGRREGVQIPGLRRRYTVQRAFRLPGLGPALRLAVAFARLPRLRREMLRLEQALAANEAAREGMAGAIGALQADGERMRRRLAEAEARLRRAGEGLAGAEERLDGTELRLRTLESESWAEPLLALADRVEAHIRRVEALEGPLRAAATLGEALRSLREAEGWPGEDLAETAQRLSTRLRDVVRRAVQAEDAAQANRRELLDQSRRLGNLLADVRGRLDQPFSAAEAARLEDADDHRLDPLYVAFEDRFRGSRADIRERQRAHLPLMAEAGAGTAARPILDVGAGRGEWLDLLRAEGLQARGVDLNRSMAEMCQGLGLDCVQGDAVEYLRSLPDGALGAVTGFHIIEHLPFRTLVALLDESLRALAPGGVILFETPNPANLMVGSRWFYLDPTHRNPLPGEMVAMIAEARGFVRAEIRELHPTGARFRARDTELAEQLDRLFHGPQDYALVARKA